MPQSFWPPDPCCQSLRLRSQKEGDRCSAECTPRIAAFLAVHSLTTIWYGKMVDESRRFHQLRGGEGPGAWSVKWRCFTNNAKRPLNKSIISFECYASTVKRLYLSDRHG